ncbi:MAG: cytochrome c553 [Janthinobacterium sp.]|jgi:cytochrome c553
MHLLKHKLNGPIARSAMLAVLLVAAAAAGAAGDVQQGRQKAQMCQACHGVDGIATMPGTPNLAGQVEMYTAMQLSAFKAGTRQNAQMSVVAQMLTPQDIEDLAAYYAAIEISVGKIPAP